MIACDVNNIGSNKTLKYFDGNLERTERDPYDGLLTNVYWFDVDRCLKKYRNEYVDYIV